MLSPEQDAAVQAWVQQLRGGDVVLIRTGRLVDEDPLVKAGVMLADPDRYFARCREERGAGSDLVTALAAAMEHARNELEHDALRPTSLTVAVMAEHLIALGWPARIDGPVAHLAAIRAQDEPDGAP